MVTVGFSDQTCFDVVLRCTTCPYTTTRCKEYIIYNSSAIWTDIIYYIYT